MALEKIKGEKDNWAQQWADTQIRKFLPFQKKWKETNRELDISTITNGHLLICDWLIGYSKSSKKWSLDK